MKAKFLSKLIILILSILITTIICAIVPGNALANSVDLNSVYNGSIVFANGVDPNNYKNFTNLSSNIAHTVYVDLSKYNKPLSKGEFIKQNAEFIKYLRDTVGNDTANKMIDQAYAASFSNKKLTSSKIVPLFGGGGGAIVQVPGINGYLWAYTNTNQDTSSSSGAVNIIWLNTDKWKIQDQIQNYNAPYWSAANGLTEYGLSGNTQNSLSWKAAQTTLDQIEKGTFTTTRYHLILIGGGYDSSQNINWVYGQCHHEYFVWFPPNHYIYANGFDEGMQAVKSATLNCPWSWYYTNGVNLNNAIDGYFSGNTFEVYMA